MMGFRFGGPTTYSPDRDRPYLVIEVWDAGSPGSAGDVLKIATVNSGDNLCEVEPTTVYDEMREGNLVVHAD